MDRGGLKVVRIVDLELDLPAAQPVPDWCVPAFANGRGDVGIASAPLRSRRPASGFVVDPWLANDGPRDRVDA